MKKIVFIVFIVFNFKSYSQDLDKIKKADTVYVYFKFHKREQYHNRETITNTKQEYDYYYYIFSNVPIYQSMTFFHHPILSPEVRIEQKIFLKKKKDIIITFKFLTKFDLGAATDLLRNKTVYLIDAKDNSKGRIKLKRVKVEGVVPNVDE